jgi:hypothetical protein
LAIAVVIAVMFVKQAIVDNKINDDISVFYTDDQYKTPVTVGGIEVIKQEVSCGYACLELLARWLGKDITEHVLLEQNDGKVSTAMGNGFVKEINKQFPEFHTIKYSNLTNSELLGLVYRSLEKGLPVPVEFAALYNSDEKSAWTLHFAIITSLDVGADKISISNPYGYLETYTLSDFLQATRYDSYKNMEIYLKFGFAAGVFKKNTIYIID